MIRATINNRMIAFISVYYLLAEVSIHGPLASTHYVLFFRICQLRRVMAGGKAQGEGFFALSPARRADECSRGCGELETVIERCQCYRAVAGAPPPRQ